MRDRRDTWDGEPIKFGSFSLGDVFDSEIKKLGRFAFRERKSTGDAVAKFVENLLAYSRIWRGIRVKRGRRVDVSRRRRKNWRG
jgi:hypothetical protein